MTDAASHALPPVPLHGLLFDVAGASAQGPRKENQDAFDVDAFVTRGVVAVADGMGGERAGRLAADTALSALMQGAEIRSLDSARYAVRAADEAVARLAQQSPDERGGMGCALALMALSVDRGGDVGWIGAHVGDVRILSRSPDGTVRLETRDHTPAYARWEAGEIALDEIPDSPGSNKLQRAVGRGGEAEATWIPVRAGWTYLLVSDGVTKAMRLDELGHAMALPSSESICQSITRKVEERGPDDNYTAVAVRVLDGGGGGGGGGDATMPAPPPRQGGVASVASHQSSRSGSPASAGGSAESPDRVGSANSPRNLFNPPAETDLNGPRRPSRSGGIAPLLIALLALGLAGYAAWAATQSSGGGNDAALAAQVDSLRNEVRSLRARAAVGDTMGVGTDSLAVAGAGAGAVTPAPGAVAPPAAPPAAAQTTTGRTTTPATPTKQP
ncbi:PP2C family protein-serine/threonine phosphatase [Longimicrobium sp.]|uniref:PP2C family protein-serine/threonine phosphatase n=1 Tax=Longimicrobium sp. TaxID=2029185 RepID=UPI003B3B357B